MSDNEVPTPRTDKNAFYCMPEMAINNGNPAIVVVADFARTLERDLTRQTERAAALERDAGRYRWLRQPAMLPALYLAFEIAPPQNIGQPIGEAIDTMIDAASAGRGGA